MKKNKHLLLGTVTLLLVATCSSVGAQEETSVNETTTENQMNTNANLTYFSDRDLNPAYDKVTANITLSGNTATIEGEGIVLENSVLKITQEGVYEFSGSSKGLQILVEATDTAKIQLVFNNVSMENEEPVIYVNEADKVFITLPEDSVNDFTDGSTRIDDTLDAVIFSRSDLTINGQGTLNITANFYNGIESKDDLRISGGVINITALNHALNANDAINIQGAILDLTAGKDGIHSENDDDKTLGNVYLNPVKLTISATEDGIDAYHLLEVAGGEIDIIQSTEGMEAMVIHQTGGNVSILSSDDGINASDGSSTSEGMFMQVNNALQIVIDDGKLTINAEGDGIDSNGTVTINGGEIYVQGSQINENGAFDAEGGVIVNGGTVLAMGTAQMVQGMISGADQASIMLNINGQAGSVVKISDNTGNILASFTATKAFQIINATVPGMVEGETYKVEVDNNLVEVTASTQAQMMNMGGIPGAGFGGRP